MNRAIQLLILTALGVMLHVANLTAGSILLGWNNLGMHCMDSSYSEFSILPPYNTIEAQLIVGGKLVTDGSGYTLTYEAVADPDGSINTTSVGKGNWIDFATLIYGKPIASADEGLNAWNMPGSQNIPQAMLFETANTPVPGATALVNWFRAEGIPITPYDDAGIKNPYPLMRLVARDAANTVIAQSDIVLPVSDEMDCRVCHGANTVAAATPTSGWITDPNPGREYRLNILRLHDDRQFANYSGLYNDALAAKRLDPAGLFATVSAGRPILCASCHSSEALGTPSFSSARGTVPPLTASMHSKHAGVTDPELNMTLDSAANRDACYRCHPGSATRCLRGAMGSAVAVDGAMAMQCQSCHGTMSQVGASTRVGWFMEPTCQNCHTGTATANNGQIRYTSVFDTNGQPRVAVDQTFATTADTPAPGISLYRFSTGHGGLQCSACHGSTHAEFPASHRNDNIGSIQHQGHAGVMIECTSCHTTMPTNPTGGPHGMHPIGQGWVKSHHDAVSQVGRAACQACHGIDYLGTELSRMQGDRTIQVANLGTQNFFRGATIGCYTCHKGPSSSSMNLAPAPSIAGVTAQTMAGVPVSMILPGAASGVTLRVISQPKNGSVGISDGVATYFPFAGFTGTDTFTFAGYDGAKNSALATGTIQVNPSDPAVQPPAITASPVSQTVIQGTAVTLTVAATGSSLQYQWYKDGWPLAGATAPTLTLAGAAADSGSYRVLVSNAAGAAASAAAVVTVLVPPTVVTDPLSQTVVMPASVTLSVTVTGTAPFSFQWYKDGVAITRATSATLRLSNVTLASSGNYYVHVTNIAGAADSAVATFDVQSAPVISTQPKTTSVTVGSPVTLSVTATGTDPMTYQWYKDTVAIPGATATSYAIPAAAVTDAGIYYVVITNPLGTATSFGAQVSVTPTISGFTPTAAAEGMTVTITGADFTGVSAVAFNGTPATFSVDTDTRITTTVPVGATTGRIAVTGPGGTATSAATFTVVPVPTITGLSPASGAAGTRVTITGTGFVAGTIPVTFNGVASASVSRISSTQVAATVPAGATTGPVALTTAGGAATSATPFTVLFPPVITSFTPTSAGVGGTVTIIGSAFSGATAVSFNGIAAAYSVISDTQLTAIVPAGATSGKITITNPDGTATSATSFTVIPPPTVTSFTPASGPVGTKVTITGTNLTGASVAFNGTAATTVTITSATSISATVPTGATTGTISVTTPGGTVTSAGSYNVTLPAPTVTAIAPVTGPAGTLVTLTGTNFTGATTVAFNGVAAPAFTVVSAASITATVPAGATTGKVSVTTPGGTATSTASFTVILPPTITSFTPVSGPVGTKVTITGTNLTGATSIKFNGTAATTVTLTSATSISATVPAGAPTGAISVTTPGGTATSAASYTVTLPAPTVTAISPASGVVGSVTTLTGTNFTGATGVTFNGVAATSFTVLSATQMTATVPATATTGKIGVTTPGGTGTSTASFTVILPPTITSFTPVSGPVGTKVTITGTNLTGATSIKFNGTAATTVTLTSATSISATVPAGATTGAISVTTPGGTATSAASYTVTLPAPTVTAISPATGGVGTSVTLTGTNFTGATAVSFNGTAAPFTVVSATSLITSVPAGAKTGKISVTTPGGTGSSTANFTVGATAVVPTITSFTPAGGPVGTVITVTGTNLAGVTAAKIGTVAAAVKVLSTTSVTITAPTGAVTGTLSVTTAGGNGTSAGTFTVL